MMCRLSGVGAASVGGRTAICQTGGALYERRLGAAYGRQGSKGQFVRRVCLARLEDACLVRAIGSYGPCRKESDWRRVTDLPRLFVSVSSTGLPRRIVSLVPSTTETLAGLGLQDRVVGRTRYCVHPRPWV